MDKLACIRAFCLVAERQSFTVTANLLEISPAMVSKRVTNLEKSLGVRLLNRTCRNISLTEAGEAYLERASLVIQHLEEAETSIVGDHREAKGKIRLTAPVWLASDLFVSIIDDFRKAYPNVQLELELNGSLKNLIEDGYDLALRCSPNLGDHYSAKPIANVSFKFVASKEYICNYGTPKNFSDLRNHRLLWYPALPKHTNGFAIEGEKESVKLNPGLVCDNESFLRIAVCRGMGIAFVPELLIINELASGELVSFLEHDRVPHFQLMAIFPSGKYLAPKIRAFVDFLYADKRLSC